jgi:hypothetical protein
MLQSDPVPGSQPPVASDVNIFDVLTGNRIMKVINTELVQIMIATEGMDFYDKQNTEKAEMLGTNGDLYYRRCSSRARIVFLDAFCTELRLGNEPVIFQTEADIKAKRQSILGKGQHPEEVALWWILGEMEFRFFRFNTLSYC